MADEAVLAAGCVLLSNSAYVQASILWATMTPIIYKFYRWGGLLLRAGYCSTDAGCLHQPVPFLMRSAHCLLAALLQLVLLTHDPACRSCSLRFSSVLHGSIP